MSTQPILLPLEVISLRDAAERYNLSEQEVATLARRLFGCERRLVDGRLGYFVSDIEDVLEAPRAAW